MEAVAHPVAGRRREDREDRAERHAGREVKGEEEEKEKEGGGEGRGCAGGECVWWVRSAESRARRAMERAGEEDEGWKGGGGCGDGKSGTQSDVETGERGREGEREGEGRREGEGERRRGACLG